jgi:hypothetical protein
MVSREISMADAPYLVALALLERDGRRELPLTGKSLAADAVAAPDPGDVGHTLALELMLRLWQRSDEGAYHRAAGDDSLLIVELPLELMSEQLPLLKANWISGAETADFLNSLRALVTRGWRLSFAKYEPVSYQRWV